MPTQVYYGARNRLMQGNQLMNKLCPRVPKDPFKVLIIIETILIEAIETDTVGIISICQDSP